LLRTAQCIHAIGKFEAEDALSSAACMWAPAAPLAASPERRHTLESWRRAHNTPKIVATRADIVLLAAEGRSNNSIASQLGITRVSVIEWRKRFAAEGLEALGKVREGRGRPRTISPE